MSRRVFSRVLASTLALALLAVACSKPDETVFEIRATLKEGEGRAFNLRPGSYQLELTATGGGVSVEWIGGECPRVESTNSLSTSCQIVREGQLVIRNPAIEAGRAVEITVKVIRLGKELRS